MLQKLSRTAIFSPVNHFREVDQLLATAQYGAGLRDATLWMRRWLLVWVLLVVTGIVCLVVNDQAVKRPESMTALMLILFGAVSLALCIVPCVGCYALRTSFARRGEPAKCVFFTLRGEKYHRWVEYMFGRSARIDKTNPVPSMCGQRNRLYRRLKAADEGSFLLGAKGTDRVLITADHSRL